MKFIAESIPRIAGARAERASALNHEVGNHSVEDEPIIKWALYFLSRARVLEFLGAFGQSDKIRDGLRGFLFKQTSDDRSLRCIEYGVCAWRSAQSFLLGMRSSQALSPIPGAETSGPEVDDGTVSGRRPFLRERSKPLVCDWDECAY